MENQGQSKTVLQVEGLCKHYRHGALVNDHIDLCLHEGEIFGLLGPNGAGKTTLINQIIGLAKPVSGKIMIDGINVVDNPKYARQVCSFQAQSQVPISGLTARQAIEIIGRIRGGQKTTVRQRTTELIDFLEIKEWEHMPGENFSGGIRRLVAFCMAVVVPGKIVILDEPTNDVDPLRRRLLWKQIRLLSDTGCTILLVTHNVLEAERAVDRLAIMEKGKVLQIGRSAEIKNGIQNAIRIEITFEPRVKQIEIPDYIEKPLFNGSRLVASLSEKDLSRATEWARFLKKNDYIEEFSLGPTTLEDAYLRIIGRQDILEIMGEGENVG